MLLSLLSVNTCHSIGTGPAYCPAMVKWYDSRGWTCFPSPVAQRGEDGAVTGDSVFSRWGSVDEAGRTFQTNTDWVLTLSGPRVWPPAAASRRCSEGTGSPRACNILSWSANMKESARHGNDGRGKQKNGIEQEVKARWGIKIRLKKCQFVAEAWVLQKNNNNQSHIRISLVCLSGTWGELPAGLLWSPDGFRERSPVCGEVYWKAKTHRSADPR